MFLKQLPELSLDLRSSTEKVKIYNDSEGAMYVALLTGLTPAAVADQIRQLMAYYFIGALLGNKDQRPAMDAAVNIANDAGCQAIDIQPGVVRRYLYTQSDVAIGVAVYSDPEGATVELVVGSKKDVTPVVFNDGLFIEI